MVTINKNQANTVTITVTENVTLTAPYFLFEFIEDGGHNKYYCISANISTTKYRFDKFTITETSNPDPLAGEVELKAGSYTYKVYEQESSTNLLVANTTSVVEFGPCEVIGTTTSDTAYNGSTTTNICYEG